MFFIIGVKEGKKKLDFSQTVVCDCCGKYGRYDVFMTYTALTLFFIPCFKWNRQYYVQTSCCHTLFELDPDVGEDILYDEKVEILPKHLTRIKQGSYCGSCKSCKNCGYETSEDFEFCPKCGERF